MQGRIVAGEERVVGRGAEGSKAGWVMQRHVRKDLGNQAIYGLDSIRSFCLGHESGDIHITLPHTGELLEKGHLSSLFLLLLGSHWLPHPRAVWKYIKYPTPVCRHCSHQGHQKLPDNQPSSSSLFLAPRFLRSNWCIESYGVSYFPDAGDPQICLQLGLSSELLTSVITCLLACIMGRLQISSNPTRTQQE